MKLTQERRQLFIEKLRTTGRVRLASIFAGVYPVSVEELIMDNPGLQEDIAKAEEAYHKMVFEAGPQTESEYTKQLRYTQQAKELLEKKNGE